MFVDDTTSLTAVGKTLDEVEERANEVRKWLCANKLSLNIAKTEYVLIGSGYKINKTDIQARMKINNHPIKRVKHTEVLGVQINENLNWEKHIECIATKISSGIGAIRKLKDFVDQNTLVLYIML